MSVTILENKNIDCWDHDLERLHGSIFMTIPWLNAIANKNREPVFLRFLKNGEQLAMLAGIITPIRNTNKTQLLFYSGFALKEKSRILESECKKRLLEYAQTNNISRVTLKSYDHHTYLNAEHRAFKKFYRSEYLLNLSKGKEYITSKFHSDFRRRARKAQREGLIFKTTRNVSFIRFLYDLLEKTYITRKTKGYGEYTYLYLPHMKEAEIESLLKSNSAMFFYAEYQNEIVSIQLAQCYQKKAYGLLMGTSEEGYSKGAPSFLFFHSTQFLADQGYHYYNLGGIQRGKSHAGLKKFKDSMNGSIIESAEESSSFLDFPLSLYNPALHIKRIMLSKTRIWIPWRIRKRLIYLANTILFNRDDL